MARLATSIKDDGRVRLYFDQIKVMKKALWEYLKNHPEFSWPEQMVIISSFQKLSKNESDAKIKHDRSNPKVDKSKS